METFVNEEVDSGERGHSNASQETELCFVGRAGVKGQVKRREEVSC